MWCAVWMYMVSDRPATHPRINAVEQEYITKAVEASMGKHTGKVSWVIKYGTYTCWSHLNNVSKVF